MKRHKLIIAILAGLLIAGSAALASDPSYFPDSAPPNDPADPLKSEVISDAAPILMPFTDDIGQGGMPAARTWMSPAPPYIPWGGWIPRGFDPSLWMLAKNLLNGK